MANFIVFYEVEMQSRKRIKKDIIKQARKCKDLMSPFNPNEVLVFCSNDHYEIELAEIFISEINKKAKLETINGLVKNKDGYDYKKIAKLISEKRKDDDQCTFVIKKSEDAEKDLEFSTGIMSALEDNIGIMIKERDNFNPQLN